MANILIVTCSLSGCTDLMAEEIKKVLAHKGHQVTIEISDEVTSEQIKTHQYILLGTYTYSMNTENEAFIPFELEDLLDILYKEVSKEKYFAIFGSSDSTYKFYGRAVDLLQTEIQSYGGEVMEEVLKVELEPDQAEDIKACQDFARAYIDFANLD